MLRALPVQGAVVQPSAVYGRGGSGAEMFNTLALLPVLMLPQAGGMRMRPVHVADVVDGIVALMVQPPPRVTTIAFVGPQSLSMADYLRALNAAMGLGGHLPLVLSMPKRLFLWGARMAGLSKSGALDAETAGMLLRGNSAPVEAFEKLLGHLPRPVSDFIAPGDVAAVRGRTLRALMRSLTQLAMAATVAALAVILVAWYFGAPFFD